MQARAAAVRSPCLPGAGTATLLAGRLAPLRAGQQQQRNVQRCRRAAVQLPRAAARPSGGKKEPAAAPPATTPGSGWLTFWAAVDTSAWLGTVGSAAAFLITQEAILAAAPVVLPLLALYASRQRERLATATDQKAQLARLEGLLLDMQADTADEVAAEVGAEVAELLQLAQKAQQRAGGDPAKLLRAVEAKLSAMEGSVLSTGNTTRDALQQSAERQGQLADRVMARLQDLGTALRRDVNGALQAAGSEDAAALTRLESRLQSLEGTIWGLQESQSEGMRRMNSGLATALTDAELSLQAAVRDEAQRSLDPLRRLPELLQQAMPVTPDLVLGPDRALPALSEDGLRLMVGEQLAAASRQMLEQQAALLEELRAQPQTIAPQQWNQLGGRLADLQDQLEQLAAGAVWPAAGGDASSSSGGGAGAEVAAVAAELTGLRSELGSLTSAVKRLLEAQQQQPAASGWAASGSGGSGMPQAMLAGVAAAVQAVQDQVVLLRQELDAEDPKQAAFAALEERLELAVTAMFEALAAEPSAGGGGAASTAAAAAAAVDGNSPAPPAVDAAATAALEAQQAALAAALESLAGLGGRLDGMSEQLAALQGSVVAAPAATAASPSIEPAAAAAGAPAAAAAPALEAATSEAATVTDGAGYAREAAYRRMQDLLQQQSTQRPEGAAGGGGGEDAAGGNSGKAFAEWLAGARENGAEVYNAIVSSSTTTSSSPAAIPAAASGLASSNGNGSVSGGVQQQIEFEAAMGAPPADQPADAAGIAAEGLSPTAPAAWLEDAGSQPAAQVEEQGQQQPQQPQQQQPLSEQQPLASMAAAAMPAEPSVEEQQALQTQRRQLYERGVQRLREGRALAATAGTDLGLADAAFWEASEAFELLLAQAPRDLKALGNYGNTLLAHGKLKRRMVEAVETAAAPADQQQAAAVAAARLRLAADAQELLLLAGRKYRSVLEVDPRQAKAFINWGRVVGLRAEMARDAGDAAEGARLFSLAADKFDNALDLEPQNGQAMRLAGQSLLDAGLCTLGGGGGDGSEEAREARALIKDAAPYFESALVLDPQDMEAAAGLEACRQQLLALKELRRAGQQQQL